MEAFAQIGRWRNNPRHLPHHEEIFDGCMCVIGNPRPVSKKVVANWKQIYYDMT